MLKQRIITAIILGSIIVFVILKLPNSSIAIIFGVITLVGAWEWSTLIGAHTFLKKLFYVGLAGAFVLTIWFFVEPELEKLILLAASLWWACVVILLSLYKSEWLRSSRLQTLLKFSGFLVLVPAWLALIELHKISPAMLMFLLVLIWVADISAYFVGKRFGKNKLAAELSPGKSREGVLGALLASIVVALIGMQLLSIDKQVGFYFVGLCLLTALISVVGDLYESLLKRKAGAKDSGTILPGHGGVLDRIDSLTAAAPGYVLGLYWLL
ncbi:MAG: phosphatidate cytidylyltransferase [Gammaproteobacteria bacterium]